MMMINLSERHRRFVSEMNDSNACARSTNKGFHSRHYCALRYKLLSRTFVFSKFWTYRLSDPKNGTDRKLVYRTCESFTKLTCKFYPFTFLGHPWMTEWLHNYVANSGFVLLLQSKTFKVYFWNCVSNKGNKSKFLKSILTP